MPIHTTADVNGGCLCHGSQPFGGNHSAEKMQGHWVLARAGKRVLRPGGLELTRQLLEALAIGPPDRVVEFAPGLGITARMALGRKPLSYCGVERDPAAVRHLQNTLPASVASFVLASAEQSNLPGSVATVVFGEALLSMQTAGQKARIISEAHRLLLPGGRFGIHELCLLPGGISGEIRHEIQAAMSRDIHVGVQPLTSAEWVQLVSGGGFKVIWSREMPMRLLEPRQVLRDEGLFGSLRICFRMAANPAIRRRVASMRRLFLKYRCHLGAISLVALRSSDVQAADLS